MRQAHTWILAQRSRSGQVGRSGTPVVRTAFYERATAMRTLGDALILGSRMALLFVVTMTVVSYLVTPEMSLSLSSPNW